MSLAGPSKSFQMQPSCQYSLNPTIPISDALAYEGLRVLLLHTAYSQTPAMNSNAEEEAVTVGTREGDTSWTSEECTPELCNTELRLWELNTNAQQRADSENCR